MIQQLSRSKRPAVETMNADIVYLLCPYLDLGSLSCFAAAYPQWSAVFHHFLRKRMPLIRLILQCGVENDGEDNVQSGEGSGDLRNDTVMKYVVAERELELPLSQCWNLEIELPQSAWKYVPFEAIAITGISITQKNCCPLPEEVHDLLAKVTASSLFMEFSTRLEARRVVRAVRLLQGSNVFFKDASKGYTDKEPIVHLSELTNVRRVIYLGRMVMLEKDLLEALHGDFVVLITRHLSPRQSAWVEKLLEKHFRAMEANQNPGLSSGYLCDIHLGPGITGLMYTKHACYACPCRDCLKQTIDVTGTGYDSHPIKFNEILFSVACFNR